MFITLGSSPSVQKDYEKTILEICNSSIGLSLIESAPKIKALYDSAISNAIKEHESRNTEGIEGIEDLF